MQEIDETNKEKEEEAAKSQEKSQQLANELDEKIKKLAEIE